MHELWHGPCHCGRHIGSRSQVWWLAFAAHVHVHGEGSGEGTGQTGKMCYDLAVASQAGKSEQQHCGLAMQSRVIMMMTSGTRQC